MNILLKARPGSPSAPAPQPSRILITSFRRTSCRALEGLRLSGELSYLTPAGVSRVKVAMTWEAYSCLMHEIRRQDVRIPEDIVVSSVLQRWGRRQLETSLARRKSPPPDGYLLDFPGGPSSLEPRSTLTACHLID
jgi:hypothetical protein